MMTIIYSVKHQMGLSRELPVMRVTREQAAETRTRIIDMASKLFREKGFDGIGVADLMKSAGLTHGGFYGHFDSKEALMTEAAACALEKSAESWHRMLERKPTDPLGTVVSSYLSTKHRDHPGAGCLIAAAGPDISRLGTPVRHSVTQGIRKQLAIIGNLLPSRSKAAKEKKALVAYSSMVGALLLSRTVEDPELSEAILQAVSASITDSRGPRR